MFSKKDHSPRRFTPLKVLSIIVIFIAIASALSALVMFLWNAILPEVVGVKPLTFWKAMGLLLLAKILFGGLGRFAGGKRHSKRRQWRNKWMKMNPEERREAKSRWKEYCKKRKRSRFEEE